MNTVTLPLAIFVSIFAFLSAFVVRKSFSEQNSSLETRVSNLEMVLGQALDVEFRNKNDTHGEVSAIKSWITQYRPKPPVCFCAVVDSGKSKVSADVPVVFEKVIVNIGNHYNPSDGIFITPFDGLYMFQWTIGTTTYIQTALVVNGEQKSGKSLAAKGAGSWGSGSFSTIQELKEGEHVWIKTRSSDVQYYSTHSIFTGLLIWPGQL